MLCIVKQETTCVTNEGFMQIRHVPPYMGHRQPGLHANRGPHISTLHCILHCMTLCIPLHGIPAVWPCYSSTILQYYNITILQHYKITILHYDSTVEQQFHSTLAIQQYHQITRLQLYNLTIYIITVLQHDSYSITKVLRYNSITLE